MKLANGKPNTSIQVYTLSTKVWDAVKFGSEISHPGNKSMSDFDTSKENFPTNISLLARTAKLEASGIFTESCIKWKVRYSEEAKTG